MELSSVFDAQYAGDHPPTGSVIEPPPLEIFMIREGFFKNGKNALQTLS